MLLYLVMITLFASQVGQRVSSHSDAHSSQKPSAPVAGKPDECCAAGTSGLALLIGNLRQDVDEAQLKGELIQLLHRRLVQVCHPPTQLSCDNDEVLFRLSRFVFLYLVRKKLPKTVYCKLHICVHTGI